MKKVINWLEDDADCRVLRWLMQDCINACMDLAKGRMTMEDNGSAEENVHWYMIIEGIKCLFICHIDEANE